MLAKAHADGTPDKQLTRLSPPKPAEHPVAGRLYGYIVESAIARGRVWWKSSPI